MWVVCYQRHLLDCCATLFWYAYCKPLPPALCRLFIFYLFQNISCVRRSVTFLLRIYSRSTPVAIHSRRFEPRVEKKRKKECVHTQVERSRNHLVEWESALMRTHGTRHLILWVCGLLPRYVDSKSMLAHTTTYLQWYFDFPKWKNATSTHNPEWRSRHYERFFSVSKQMSYGWLWSKTNVKLTITQKSHNGICMMQLFERKLMLLFDDVE